MQFKTTLAGILTFAAVTAMAMPTPEALKAAEPMVIEMMADGQEAVAGGTKTRRAVAALALERAAEAKDEAVKLLLCKGAVHLYVRDGAYDEASSAFATLRSVIPGFRVEYARNLLDGALAGLAPTEGGALRRLREGLNGKAVASAAPSDLQKRVDAARDGATVTLAPGRHAGSVRIVGKRLMLVASDPDPRKTTLVGGADGSVVFVGAGAAGTVLRGLTLTGGAGTELAEEKGASRCGGGLCAVSDATLENCIVRGNGKGTVSGVECVWGGGVWCVSNATVRLKNCLVVDNSAWACAGGVGASKAALELDGCTVVRNQTTDHFGKQGGLGLASGGRARVRQCLFALNSGDSVGALGGSGSRGTAAVLLDCVVAGGARSGGIRSFSAENCPETELTFTDDGVAEGVFVPDPAVASDWGFRLTGSVKY